MSWKSFFSSCLWSTVHVLILSLSLRESKFTLSWLLRNRQQDIRAWWGRKLWNEGRERSLQRKVTCLYLLVYNSSLQCLWGYGYKAKRSKQAYCAVSKLGVSQLLHESHVIYCIFVSLTVVSRKCCYCMAFEWEGSHGRPGQSTGSAGCMPCVCVDMHKRNKCLAHRFSYLYGLCKEL